MLRRVNGLKIQNNGMEETGAAIRIADAPFPAPFVSQLEFNAPVHGPWNIVHVGMLVPECHQIYVCSDNCMRGVVLTAAEMGLSDRFSCVLLEEGDLYEGNMENVTIDGITDAINRLPYRPRAVAVFLVCLHHFVGTDISYVYSRLEERFPDIDFMRCWMDPVMRKSGLAPEQKLKDSMFRPVRALPVEKDLVCVLGDNQPLDPDSELAAVIRARGCRILQLQTCSTYDDYLRIGAGALFLTCSPAGVHGVSRLAKRLGRPFLYLPPSCGEEEIRGELRQLSDCMESCGIGREEDSRKESSPRSAGGGIPTAAFAKDAGIDAHREDDPAARAKAALVHARALLGDTEITLDHVVTSRPLSLARLLLENGFCVSRVYLDAILPVEKEDFLWLQANHPGLMLYATVHPKMRVLHEKEKKGSMLAIGPKAAWFGGTSRFVNLVELGGLWGFTGIEKLASLMEDAFLHEKDTRQIVPRKGFGCACVL